MSLVHGTTIGVYQVVALIGSGGMGEVYRARDTRLNRDVALKVLPENFAQDGERLARFKREAQLLASLNHPHIASIHGLEEANHIHALVLELVEGPTLADRIAQGPIPMDQALPIMRQIAEALEAAHEHGIIHRDLKPANIKLTSNGAVKVLDFGLAKAMDNGGVRLQPDLSASPTITSPAMTMGRVILGTAAYMSPEQAKGKPLDKRTDIWSFGCVLYEMVTGRRAFDGEDVTEVLARIIEREPDFAALPATTPASVRALITRTLRKDRNRRLADIADARIEMEDAMASPAQAGDASSRGEQPTRLRRLLVTGVAASLAAAVSGAAAWVLKPNPPRPVTRFEIAINSPLAVLTAAVRRTLSVSPDGSRLVYVADQMLNLRNRDALDSSVIQGTNSASGPFFSPDGRWIAFWQSRHLKKIALSGGPAIEVSDLSRDWGASWDSDGILFSKGAEGIWRVSTDGGNPSPVVTLDPKEGLIVEAPQMLPGGKAVLFTLTVANPAQSVQALADTAQIVTQQLDTGERKILVSGGVEGRYVKTGHLIYVRQGSLMAVAFDPDRLAVTGSPVALLEGVAQSHISGGIGPGGASTGAQYTVSDDGLLAFLELPRPNTQRTLVWVDRQGRETPILAPVRAYVYPRLSPDGTRVALDIRDQEQDIHVWDVKRETLTRLTFRPGPDIAPVWAPDGRRIAFAEAGRGIVVRAADGTGSAQPVTEQGESLHVPAAFSSDGTRLLINESNPDFAVKVVTFGPKLRMQTFVQTPAFDELNPSMSPDGRWVAYQSNESGRYEIYVRPFPNADGGRWQLSTEGGARPVWSRSGEVFYLQPGGGPMMSVSVDTRSGFSSGNPVKLFSGAYYTGLTGTTYDVAPDGQRFLMIKLLSQSPVETPRIVVVENWFEEVKQKVPVR